MVLPCFKKKNYMVLPIKYKHLGYAPMGSGIGNLFKIKLNKSTYFTISTFAFSLQLRMALEYAWYR